jgi:hypothetical protein
MGNTIKLLLILILFTSVRSENVYVKNKSQTSIEEHLKYNVYRIKKGEMSFGVSEKIPTDSDFYINSNFFTSNADPIGLVVVDGKRKNNRTKGGGYFYVKNGKPYVKTKTSPKRTEFSSQTILWGIDDGIINKNLLNKKHSNLKRYRTLMGQTKSGDIIIISSNLFGLVSIPELLEFSSDFEIVDGILLDGGTSVDYKFTDCKLTKTFKSVPLGLKKVFKIKEPTTYIYGNFN